MLGNKVLPHASKFARIVINLIYFAMLGLSYILIDRVFWFKKIQGGNYLVQGCDFGDSRIFV